MENNSLFKTRQLSKYRAWTGNKKGCLFYVADITFEKECAQGAIYLIESSIRKEDEKGFYDKLHKSEENSLRTIKPVAKGFAAFLLTQDCNEWIEDREILYQWWSLYYKWCMENHPKSGFETEYILCECRNWTNRMEDLIKSYIFDPARISLYGAALLYIIKNVFVRNTESIDDIMRKWKPYVSITQSTDTSSNMGFIRYEYSLNALKNGEKMFVQGVQAVILQYAIIQHIRQDIQRAQSLDKIIEIISNQYIENSQNTLSFAKIKIPKCDAEIMERLYEYSWKRNKELYERTYKLDLPHYMLSDKELELLFVSKLYDMEMNLYRRNELSSFLSAENLQNIRLLLIGYFKYLFKKMEGYKYVHYLYEEFETEFPELQRNESHSQEQKGYVIQQNINAQGDYFAGGIGIQFVNGKQPQPTTASQKGTTIAPKKSKHFLETATFKYRYLNTDEGNRRLYLLYQFLSREYHETKSYIDPEIAPDDFCSLFSGETNNTVITWTGSKQDLYYLIKRMVDRHIIDIPSSTTIWTITQNHFSDRRGNIFLDLRNQHKPKTSAEAIEHLIDILDPAATTPADLTELSKKLSTAFGGK